MPVTSLGIAEADRWTGGSRRGAVGRSHGAPWSL